MCPIDSVKEISAFQFEEDVNAAIAVSKPHYEQLHCGILYKNEDQIHLLHLANHCQLMREDTFEDTSKEWIWVKSTIHNSKLKFLAGLCRTIYDNKTVIRYGFYFGNTQFNQQGILSLDNEKRGLTCATFVLAVFIAYNIRLIDIGNWPVREEDAIWHKKIIQYLTKHKDELKVSDEHLKNITEEIGCARYRPEEVAAASSFDIQPEDYVKTRSLGKEISDFLYSLS